MSNRKKQLLSVKDLKVNIKTDNGLMTIVDGVSFHIDEGEVLALVGESGCGKSMTALSLLRLLPRNASIEGEILFKGEDIVKASKATVRHIRGGQISMIFQEPMTSLNPVHRVGDQIVEAIRSHLKVSRKEANELSVEMLNKVGIPDPSSKAKQFPHHLSGGQRQRVMIAMALACKPALLIADEPTTALDVTIQEQILGLMRNLKNEFNTSMLFISHDLGVVSEIADRIAVMYTGRIVEVTPSQQLFLKASHPYTKGLIRSVPDGKPRGERLNTIEGTVPPVGQFPSGCRFAPRCPHSIPECITQDPSLISIDSDTKVACILYQSTDSEVVKEQNKKGSGVYDSTFANRKGS